jgi:hypothetical protein
MLFTAFTIAVVAAAVIFHPDDWLIGEDRVLETLSALLYAGAALLAASALLRKRTSAHRALWFILVFGLVCALDEISFGARIFGFAPVIMPNGAEYDGVHDVLLTAVWRVRKLPEDHRALFDAAAVAGLVMALGLALLLRRRVAMLVQRVMAEPVLLRIGACLGLIALAQAVDVGLIAPPRPDHLEEWGEASGGFWLFAAAIAAATATGPVAVPRPPRRLQAMSATSPTATRMLYATTRNDVCPTRPNSAAPTRTKPSSTGTSSATFTSTSAVNSPPT